MGSIRYKGKWNRNWCNEWRKYWILLTTSKNLAIADLNSLKDKNKKVVKENSKEKEEYKPKNLNEDNDVPKIKISKSIVVKQANYKISGEVEDQSDKIFIEVDGQTIIAENGNLK